MSTQLNPLAERILSLLIFEESYGHITEELKDLTQWAVADELKNLIVSDYVRPYRDLSTGRVSGIHYDSDRMESFSFILTSKGIGYLENRSKSLK